MTDYIFPISSDSYSRISSGYGGRPPINGVPTASISHKGLDVAAAAGTPILSMQAGTVIYNGTSGVVSGPNKSGYGNVVIVQNTDGTAFLYAHLETGSSLNLQVGTFISQGTPIGAVGSTGGSSGPHLHLGLIDEASADAVSASHSTTSIGILKYEDPTNIILAAEKVPLDIHVDNETGQSNESLITDIKNSIPIPVLKPERIIIDDGNGNITTYYVDNAQYVRELALNNGYNTLEGLLSIAGNEDLGALYIPDLTGTGIDLILTVENQLVYLNPADIDGEIAYSILNNGYITYDSEADNPIQPSVTDNSLLDFDTDFFGSAVDTSDYDLEDLLWEDGGVFGDGTYSATMASDILNSDGYFNVAPSFIVSDGWRPGAMETSTYSMFNDFSSIYTPFIDTLDAALAGFNNGLIYEIKNTGAENEYANRIKT